ncbi:hypothetical protein GCM10027446_00710 [Angustibacter peucedani]
MRQRVRVVASGLAALALALLLVLFQELRRSDHPRSALLVVGAMFAVFVGGALALLQVRHRLAPVAAVAVGAGLQLVALRTAPLTTDDYLRYAWDGRVQASGTDPYRYAPGDPALARLRDAWLFPDGVTPRLNHPGERTVYPPVAEAWFWLVHVLTGGRGEALPLQVAAASLSVATAVAVLVVLRRTGGDPRRVVWWSWCPTVVLEAGGGAHVDVLASLLVVVALGLLVRRSWTSSGVVLGLAVATKFLPVLVAASVPPRRSVRVGIAAVAAVLVVYLPHVAVLGTDVTGFLGGYLGEESTDRFDLLRVVLPDVVVEPVGVLLVAATLLLVWRRAARQQQEPWHGAAVAVGVAFLLIEPAYPWYALLLVPLVALGARLAWLAVVAAPYLVYAAADLGHRYELTRVVGYGVAGLVVLAASWRARSQRLTP